MCFLVASRAPFPFFLLDQLCTLFFWDVNLSVKENEFQDRALDALILSKEELERNKRILNSRNFISSVDETFEFSEISTWR